jgi:hypothetical protein
MLTLRSLALISALAMAAPTVAWGAQRPSRRAQPRSSPAFQQGYDRGVRAGLQDGRRHDAYRFTDESDYRRGDVGYRGTYGSRDRYRDEFRLGFESGYRMGYSRTPAMRRYDGRGALLRDPASATGFNDGYEAGLKDAQKNRQFDPVSEGRYRDGDHGYDRNDGPKEIYKLRYRDAFKSGYGQGYQDGRRYR